MPEQFGANDVGSAVQPCGRSEPDKPVHWIEIELVGEDDSPIPWEEYTIELPNGDVVRGYLDQEGWARVDNIDDPGACQVTFTKLDKDAWARHSESPTGPKHDL